MAILSEKRGPTASQVSLDGIPRKEKRMLVRKASSGFSDGMWVVPRILSFVPHGLVSGYEGFFMPNALALKKG